MQDEAQSLPHAIFIYGTLKRGQPNHAILQHFGICKLFSSGCTELKYPLIIDTEANLPFMLDAPGKGQTVYGEIYHVGDDFLARLDRFEGHPHLYQRDVISVRVISCEDDMTRSSNNIETEKQEIMKCNTYLKKDFDKVLLDKETYSSYHSEGSHGLPYRKEYDTD